MGTIDLAALWNFGDPAGSEARMRAAMAGAGAEDAAILRTQIARTFGLRREFSLAREELAPLLEREDELAPEARVRTHLELGRTLCSATHPAESLTPQARAEAGQAYQRAAMIAREHGLDGLAVDALHMMAFTETDPARALAWSMQALEASLASTQPAARRWEASLRNNIGCALHELGRHDEALEMFERAQELHEATGDPGRVRVARWMVAWTLRAMRRHDEALRIQHALEAEHEAAGTTDPHVYAELAHLYRAMGDAAAAANYEALAAQGA